MLKKRADIEPELLNDEKINFLTSAAQFLKPFQEATDLVQSDSASPFSLIRAAFLLENTKWSTPMHTQWGEILAVVLRRRWLSNIWTPQLAALCFFMPILDRSTVDDVVRDFVGTFVINCAPLIRTPSEEVQTVRKGLEREWLRFVVQPPRALESEVTCRDDYETWWRDLGVRKGFPKLCSVALAVCAAIPSEACVERSFSKAGLCVTDVRNALSAEGVESQIIINSLWKQHTETEEVIDDAEITLSEVHDVLQNITPEAMPHTEVQQQRSKRLRSQDSLCGLCKVAFAQHAPSKWVQCEQCELWFSFRCCHIPEAMEALMQTCPWKCTNCEYGNA